MKESELEESYSKIKLAVKLFTRVREATSKGNESICVILHLVVLTANVELSFERQSRGKESKLKSQWIKELSNLLGV